MNEEPGTNGAGMNALTASTWINQSGIFLVFCTTIGRWGNEEMHEVLNNFQAA
jgi:hypothetical protein